MDALCGRTVRVAVCGGCLRLSIPSEGACTPCCAAPQWASAAVVCGISAATAALNQCNHAVMQSHVIYIQCSHRSDFRQASLRSGALRPVPDSARTERARAPSWARAAAGQCSTRAAARAARASRQPRRARQRAAAAAPLDPAAGQRPRCAQPGRGGARRGPTAAAPPSAGSSARRPHALTMPLRRPSLCRLGHVRGREAAGGIAIFLCGACAAARMREGCSGYACRCPRARDGRQASKGAL